MRLFTFYRHGGHSGPTDNLEVPVEKCECPASYEDVHGYQCYCWIPRKAVRIETRIGDDVQQIMLFKRVDRLMNGEIFDCYYIRSDLS